MIAETSLSSCEMIGESDSESEGREKRGSRLMEPGVTVITKSLPFGWKRAGARAMTLARFSVADPLRMSRNLETLIPGSEWSILHSVEQAGERKNSHEMA